MPEIDVVPNGLRGLYLCEDNRNNTYTGTGALAALSAHGFDGATTYANGKYNKGISKSIQFPSNDIFKVLRTSSATTICFWYKLNSGGWIGLGYGTFDFNPNDNLVSISRTSIDSGSQYNSDVIFNYGGHKNDGNFHFCAITFEVDASDSQVISIYIDGVFQDSLTVSFHNSNDDPDDPLTQLKLTSAVVDSIRVYNRALSQAEITTINNYVDRTLPIVFGDIENVPRHSKNKELTVNFSYTDPNFRDKDATMTATSSIANSGTITISPASGNVLDRTLTWTPTKAGTHTITISSHNTNDPSTNNADSTVTKQFTVTVVEIVAPTLRVEVDGNRTLSILEDHDLTISVANQFTDPNSPNEMHEIYGYLIDGMADPSNSVTFTGLQATLNVASHAPSFTLSLRIRNTNTHTLTLDIPYNITVVAKTAPVLSLTRGMVTSTDASQDVTLRPGQGDGTSASYTYSSTQTNMPLQAVTYTVQPHADNDEIDLVHDADTNSFIVRSKALNDLPSTIGDVQPIELTASISDIGSDGTDRPLTDNIVLRVMLEALTPTITKPDADMVQQTINFELSRRFNVDTHHGFDFTYDIDVEYQQADNTWVELNTSEYTHSKTGNVVTVVYTPDTLRDNMRIHCVAMNSQFNVTADSYYYFEVVANRTPVLDASHLSSISTAKRIQYGVEDTFTLTAVDPEGDAITVRKRYGALSSSALSFTESAGEPQGTKTVVYTYTPTRQHVRTNAYTFGLTYRDSENNDVDFNFDRTVYALAPTLTIPAFNNRVRERDRIRFPIVRTDPNIPSENTNVTLAFTNPVTNAPTFRNNRVNWRAEAHSGGNSADTHTLRITVTNQSGETAVEDVNIVVYANTPPLLQDVADIEQPYNLGVNIELTATDADIGTTVTYHLDESTHTKPSTATLTGNMFTWSPTLADVSATPYTVVFYARDDQGAESNRVSVDITITALAPPTISRINSRNIQVGEELIVNIQAEDHNTPPQTITYGFQDPKNEFRGAMINSSTGRFTWSPDTVGAFVIQFTATTDHGTVSTNMNVTVLTVQPPSTLESLQTIGVYVNDVRQKVLSCMIEDSAEKDIPIAEIKFPPTVKIKHNDDIKVVLDSKFKTRNLSENPVFLNLGDVHNKRNALSLPSSSSYVIDDGIIEIPVRSKIENRDGTEDTLIVNGLKSFYKFENNLNNSISGGVNANLIFGGSVEYSESIPRGVTVPINQSRGYEGRGLRRSEGSDTDNAGLGIALNDISLRRNFTIAFWFKVGDGPSTSNNTVFSVIAGINPVFRLVFRNRINDIAIIGKNKTIDLGNLTNNNHKLFVLQRDGIQTRLYIDPQNENDYTGIGHVDWGDDIDDNEKYVTWEIHKSATTSEWHDLDSFRIYDRALPYNEITDLKNFEGRVHRAQLERGHDISYLRTIYNTINPTKANFTNKVALNLIFNASGYFNNTNRKIQFEELNTVLVTLNDDGEYALTNGQIIPFYNFNLSGNFVIGFQIISSNDDTFFTLKDHTNANFITCSITNNQLSIELLNNTAYVSTENLVSGINNVEIRRTGTKFSLYLNNEEFEEVTISTFNPSRSLASIGFTQSGNSIIRCTIIEQSVLGDLFNLETFNEPVLVNDQLKTFLRFNDAEDDASGNDNGGIQVIESSLEYADDAPETYDTSLQGNAFLKIPNFDTTFSNLSVTVWYKGDSTKPQYIIGSEGFNGHHGWVFGIEGQKLFLIIFGYASGQYRYRTYTHTISQLSLNLTDNTHWAFIGFGVGSGSTRGLTFFWGDEDGYIGNSASTNTSVDLDSLGIVESKGLMIGGRSYTKHFTTQDGALQLDENSLIDSLRIYSRKITTANFTTLANFKNTIITPTPLSPPVMGSIANREITEKDSISINLSATDPDSLPLEYSIRSGAGSINGSRYTVSGSGLQIGENPIIIQVLARGGEPADETDFVLFYITVRKALPSPPSLNSIGFRSATVGQTLTINLSATDPDGLAIRYSRNGVGSISGSRYTFTPTASHIGIHSVTFIATAQGGIPANEFATETISIVVSNTVTVTQPSPPSLFAIGNKNIQQGNTLTFDLNGSDPNSLPLTYSHIGVGALNGRRYTFTPTTGQVGSHSVRFQVLAQGGTPSNESDSETIRITVTAPPPELVQPSPPTLNSIGNRTIEVGQTLTINLSGSDPDNLPLAYSVSSSKGNLTGNTFTYTAVQADIGTFIATFTATAGGGNPANETDSERIVVTITGYREPKKATMYIPYQIYGRNQSTRTSRVIILLGESVTFDLVAKNIPANATITFDFGCTIGGRITEAFLRSYRLNNNKVGSIQNNRYTFTSENSHLNDNAAHYWVNLKFQAHTDISGRTRQTDDYFITILVYRTGTREVRAIRPVMKAIPTQRVEVGETLTIQHDIYPPPDHDFNTVDPDPSNPQKVFQLSGAFNASNRGNLITMDNSTGLYTFTPTNNEIGILRHVVHGWFRTSNYIPNVQGSVGQQAYHTIVTINVVAASTTNIITPSPPSLAAIGNKSVRVGNTLTLTLSATDPNNLPLSYSKIGVGTLTGRVFTYRPSASLANTNQSVTFKVIASGGNPANEFDQRTIQISVLPSATTTTPSASPPSFVVDSLNANVEAGETATIQFSYSDPNNLSLSTSLRGSSVGRIRAHNTLTNTSVWSWSNATVGTHTVTIRVTASGGTPSNEYTERTFTIIVRADTTTVIQASPPSVRLASNNISLRQNATSETRITASDPNNLTLDYTLTGIGSIVLKNGNYFYVPNTDTIGTYNFTITVTAQGGNPPNESASVSGTVTITTPPFTDLPKIIFDGTTLEGSTRNGNALITKRIEKSHTPNALNVPMKIIDPFQNPARRIRMHVWNLNTGARTTAFFTQSGINEDDPKADVGYTIRTSDITESLSAVANKYWIYFYFAEYNNNFFQSGTGGGGDGQNYANIVELTIIKLASPFKQVNRDNAISRLSSKISQNFIDGLIAYFPCDTAIDNSISYNPYGLIGKIRGDIRFQENGGRYAHAINVSNFRIQTDPILSTLENTLFACWFKIGSRTLPTIQIQDTSGDSLLNIYAVNRNELRLRTSLISILSKEFPYVEVANPPRRSRSCRGCKKKITAKFIKITTGVKASKEHIVANFNNLAWNHFAIRIFKNSIVCYLNGIQTTSISLLNPNSTFDIRNANDLSILTNTYSEQSLPPFIFRDHVSASDSRNYKGRDYHSREARSSWSYATVGRNYNFLQPIMSLSPLTEQQLNRVNRIDVTLQRRLGNSGNIVLAGGDFDEIRMYRSNKLPDADLLKLVNIDP